MRMGQHQIREPGRYLPPVEGVDHEANNRKQMRGAKASQLRGHWIRLQRAVTNWANRRDELRAHEARMFEEAKKELDRVEAQLDAMNKANVEAEAE